MRRAPREDSSLPVFFSPSLRHFLTYPLTVCRFAFTRHRRPTQVRVPRRHETHYSQFGPRLGVIMFLLLICIVICSVAAFDSEGMEDSAERGFFFFCGWQSYFAGCTSPYHPYRFLGASCTPTDRQEHHSDRKRVIEARSRT